MIIRELIREEVEDAWRIDRREIIENVYRVFICGRDATGKPDRTAMNSRAELRSALNEVQPSYEAMPHSRG